MITEMTEKGFRAYNIRTSFYKRYIDIIQKRLNIEIVIGSENLLFVKTTDYSNHHYYNKFTEECNV